MPELEPEVAERSASKIAIAVYQAYADGDRNAIEPLIADDFRFISPLDNGLDRATYFERCWPNHQSIAQFDFLRVIDSGDEAIVTYEIRTVDGRRFRNTEALTARDGQLTRAEVYFGWSVPHDAPAGGFIERS